jgi:hypothetical protein
LAARMQVSLRLLCCYRTASLICRLQTFFLYFLLSLARAAAPCHHERSGYQSPSLVPSPDEMVVCKV